MRQMKRERLAIPAAELEVTLLPRLIGPVFHVTSWKGYEGILKSGAILSNQDGRFGFTFPQSENSFGRQRGYVCLFDLRSVPGEDLKLALRKFYFLNPHWCDDRPVFLLLSDAFHHELIPWTAGDAEGIRIPDVEAWYPGNIELEKISNVLEVRVYRTRAEKQSRARLLKHGLFMVFTLLLLSACGFPAWRDQLMRDVTGGRWHAIPEQVPPGTARPSQFVDSYDSGGRYVGYGVVSGDTVNLYRPDGSRVGYGTR